MNGAPEATRARGRWFGPLLAGLIAIGAAVSLGAVVAPYPNQEILVDSNWLERRLGDPSVRVIDARGPLAYRQGHIPEAVNVGDREIHTFAPAAGRVLKSIDELEEVFRRAGIDRDTIVVIYGDGRSPGMPERLFWLLEYLGHPRVRLLAGGFETWREAGGEISRETPAVASGSFRAQPRADRLATPEDILAIQRNGDGHIVDMRSEEEFRGASGQTPRLGHIPGAANVRFDDLFEGPALPRRAHTLRLAWAAVDVHPWHKTVVYGTNGIDAAPGYFAMRLLGNPDVRVYEGSWPQWAADATLPVETAPTMSGGPVVNRSTTCW